MISEESTNRKEDYNVAQPRKEQNPGISYHKLQSTRLRYLVLPGSLPLFLIASSLFFLQSRHTLRVRHQFYSSELQANAQLMINTLQHPIFPNIISIKKLNQAMQNSKKRHTNKKTIRKQPTNHKFFETKKETQDRR